MEMSYVNDGIYRFLEVRLGSKEDIVEKGLICKLRMLEKNDIAILISPFENEIDGRLILRFNTKAYYVFDRYLQRKKPDGEFLRLFLKQLVECVNKMEEYLLSPNDIVLQPMYMYIDTREHTMRLICVPGYTVDMRIQLKGILEYMMKIFDHHDQNGVNLLYDLYDRVTEDDFDIRNYMCAVKKTKDNSVMAQEVYYGENVRVNQRIGYIENCTINQAKGYRENKTINYDTEYGNGKVVNQTVRHPYVVDSQSDEYREHVVFEEGDDDTPTVKQKVCLVLLFLVSVISCLIYIFGGHSLIWLTMSLLFFVVCATEIFLVFREVKHDRELREDMEAYKLEAISATQAGGNTLQYAAASENYKKQVRVPCRLVPLSNGALASIEIKADGMLVIGRGKDTADYILDRTQISRVHARLYRGEGKLMMCDAGSTNGTFVNNKRLDAETYVELKSGDIVAFADEEFFVA